MLRVKYMLKIHHYLLEIYEDITADRSKFPLIKQAEEYISPPNGNSWQYHSKSATLLLSPVVETHGVGWQNVR
jgi:hypothetical protein